MSVYVTSDIHGCYQEFQEMLSKIGFSPSDRLILAGDCIDRGKDTYQMLQWIENCPKNAEIIRGNHEEEFAAMVSWMLEFDRKKSLHSDFTSNGDAVSLYQSVQYFFQKDLMNLLRFDAYGTIHRLLCEKGATLEDLDRWAKRMRQMPYYLKCEIGGRPCVAVHAGYAGRLEDIEDSYSSLEEFYLYAREESMELGGICHGMVIAGHTPTVARWEFAYNQGNVFQHYDADKDCVFYDIDCGCAYRTQDSDAKLACIRLEDERIFYV